MKTLILDASVLAKTFVKEDNSEKAMELIDGYLKGEYSIIISELTIWEILNALKYHNAFPNEMLSKVGEALYYYGFKIINLNLELIQKTIEIALENNITIYDATYLALTELHKGEFITADKKLYEKLHNKHPIKLLTQGHPQSETY